MGKQSCLCWQYVKVSSVSDLGQSGTRAENVWNERKWIPGEAAELQSTPDYTD